MQQCSNDQMEKIVELFRSIQRKMREVAAQKFRAYGFTLPQLNLVFILYETPDIMLNELTKKMGLSQSTVSSIVDRLVNQGVVVRQIPKDNRRSVHLSLSPEFMENNRSLLDYKNKFLDDIFNFQGLSAEDADTIIYALGKVDNLFRPVSEKIKENPAVTGCGQDDGA
jgi:DNA-binding MarR family transcriptional regulator